MNSFKQNVQWHVLLFIFENKDKVCVVTNNDKR